MEGDREIKYTEELEELISQDGERSQGMSWLHSKSANHFSHYNTYLALPIIVLSTLSGTASASGTNLIPDARAGGLAIGAVSIFVGILSTLQSYFGYAKRSEAHRLSGINYSKLNRFITVEMSLPRSQRIQAGDFLKIVREQIERLMETSPPVPDFIVAEFKHISKHYPEVALPDEANGLRAINKAPLSPGELRIKIPPDSQISGDKKNTPL